MNKELEALEQIKTLRTVNKREFDNDENVNKSLDIIKQALLELQSIKEAKPSEAIKALDRNIVVIREKDYTIINQYLLKAEKFGKAWEVVKEKGVDVATFNDYQTVIEYNWSIRFEKYKRKLLTQEEFESVKEMVE